MTDPRRAPDPREEPGASGGQAANRVVGIVGAGTMGAGIAQVSLQAGHEVLLHDVDAAALARGRERIAIGLTRLVDKGRLTPDRRDEMLAALHDEPDLDELAKRADLVVEAALEDLPVKRTLFRRLDMQSLPDVPLATNTSALSVAEIAEATHHRERVLGLHFFNPAPVMPLVEVVVPDAVDRAVIETALAFVRELGKTPVVCRDSPGFIVNRVNRPFTLEALRLLERGAATVAEIDAAVEAAGYPMGPFRLMDLVGVDVNLAVARTLYDAFDEAGRFRPSPIQEQMVASGRLGRKVGLGFYRYADDGSASEAEPPPASAPPAPSAPPTSGASGRPALAPAAIVEHIELAILNEAYRAVGDIVAEPGDIDLAMRLGANHPHGPFERAGQLGLRRVVEGLRRLHDDPDNVSSGDQFEVAPLLWQMATV